VCLQGDEGLIELAEGETLPVVDEAGNTLGTLHADGRVLDDAGQEIGMLDDEGNVVLFEQQAAEGECERCYFVVTFMLPSGQAGVLDDAGQEIGMLDDDGSAWCGSSRQLRVSLNVVTLLLRLCRLMVKQACWMMQATRLACWTMMATWRCLSSRQLRVSLNVVTLLLLLCCSVSLMDVTDANLIHDA
jgi:hypothetical protein